MPFYLGVLAASVKRIITDIFNRTTSGSLGTSNTGQIWSNLRGVWYANGTQAKSDTAASSYPIASINVGSPNAVTSASVSSGTGVAFWLTDSGNWWASTSYNTSSSYTYSCNPTSCFCGSYSCLCADGVSSSSSGCSSPSYIGSCSEGCDRGCASHGGVSSITSCNASMTTCYDTCTAYNYFYYLKLTNSIAGTVSSVVSDVTLSAQPAAIKVTTSGNSITAQAYADIELTTPLGSPATATPASPLKSNNVGVIVAPTAYNQQSTVDNFSSRSL